jgi:glutamine synthetase
MEPQDSPGVLGPFFWTDDAEEARMSELEERHFLRNGGETLPDAREALEWATETRATMIDLKFCDLLGTWQHMSLPVRALSESAFDEGLGFDGSSIRGWQGIQESDMLLMPQAESAILDPATQAPTLSLVCEIVDPVTHEAYAKDPRQIARRAEDYLRSTGIADTVYIGPECEFFVFDEVSYELGPNRAHYAVDSPEGYWNSGTNGLGYTARPKEGYFPTSPTDSLHDLRTEIVLTLERIGIPCEFHHHEVASGGQCEIDLRFTTLTRMADQVMTYKYVVKNVARRHGMAATFMPKPIFGDNGSGMHTHQSLWKEGTPLMADKSGYAGLSQLGRAYVAGLLAHAPALLAFCAPTTNSYRRLIPGFEAPVNLVYSQRNRSACIRIPMYSESPKAKRIEFRPPDAAANPYLAFAAMLMAGLDGVERGLDPGTPADYDLFEDAGADVPQVPGSLDEALDALEADHEFLLRGEVFSEGLLDTWIAWKRENEIDTVRLRPHPAEFGLYFDC